MKTKNKDGNVVEAELSAFSFWECEKIGINIDDLTTPGWIGGFDLSLVEAKTLVKELLSAISVYEHLESYIPEDKDLDAI